MPQAGLEPTTFPLPSIGDRCSNHCTKADEFNAIPFHSFMFVTRWSPSGTRYGCAQGQPQSHYSQPGTPGHRRCNSCKRPLHSLYNRCIAYAKHKTTAGRAFAQLNMCFASHWPCVSLCHLPSLAPVYTHDTQALSNPKPSPPPPPGLYARQWMESTWMQSKISI